MKARDVIGRTIVSVDQYRIHTQEGWATSVTSFELDNGTSLHLFANDDPTLDTGYVTVDVVKRS